MATAPKSGLLRVKASNGWERRAERGHWLCMARYYFHLSAAERLLKGDVGEEFATEEKAHAYGAQVASGLRAIVQVPRCFLM